MPDAANNSPVRRCDPTLMAQLNSLLQRYHITIEPVATRSPIPGSFFGDPEAGLIRNRLYVRSDTPLHSALHEACHYICMDPQRRAMLHTDAEGDYAEENGVCYLQIILADYLPGMGKVRMMQDMDRWGYTFRLGSARAWFEQDAEDARDWLIHHRIIDNKDMPTWQLRHC